MEALQAKWIEIRAFIAKDLGLKPIESMSSAEREQLDTETQDAIDEWSEAEHDDRATPLEPKTPLQHLFAQYRELEDQELDRRDRKAGLY